MKNSEMNFLKYRKCIKKEYKDQVACVHIIEESRVREPRQWLSGCEYSPNHNVFASDLVECGVVDWIKEKPTEFITEFWVIEDVNETVHIGKEYKCQLKSYTEWKGVIWLDVAHTNPEDSLCAGISTFTFEEKTTKQVEDGKIVTLININPRHPDGKRILKQNL